MYSINIENVAKLNEALQAVKLPEGMPYQLPPPSFATLGGEFINYEPARKLITGFRVPRHFSNPQGTVQGGIIAACFDDTFGPLGVATCKKPIVSIDMNVQYLRPVPLDEPFYIETEVTGHSRTTLFLSAKAFNLKNKLMAQATTNQLIVR
jgi:acyl-coenzyme A thioesterase PaaI-like protein